MNSFITGVVLSTTVMLSSAIGGSAKVDPQKASITQFIKMRAPRSAHLGPSGELYYIDLADGVNQLFRRAGGDKDAKVLTSFKDGVGGYSVSYDGKWVTVTAGHGGDEQYDIYLINTATDKIEPLFVDRDTVYGTPLWLRDSSGFAFRANKDSKADFYLYTYDLDSKSARTVSTRPGYWYPVDFRMDNSRMLAGHYISASESELWEISLIGEGSRPVTSFEEKWSHSGVGYGPDERYVYTVTDYHGDRNTLHVIDCMTSGIEPVLPELKDQQIDFAVLSDDRSTMAVVVNADGYAKLHLFSMPDLKPLPTPEIPDGVVRNVMFQGRTLLYSLSNANSPGIFYKWTLNDTDSKPTPLTVADTQGIDINRFRLPRLVKFKTFDGLEIPAFLFLPEGYRKGTSIPFIVSYHGGPEGQYRPYFSRVFQYFVSRGFGVLAPNVRGSSGYGTKYLEMDNYKKRMNSVKDGVAAAEWLVDNKYSSPKKIAAYGGSYGGFMVIAVITQAPELFGAACDIVGIVNFETFLKRTKAYRRKLREAEYGPLTDPEFLKSISPIYLVDRVKTPVLIAHGKNDPRVPVSEAEQLYAALKKRNMNPELIVFDDEGHGFRKEANRIKFYGRLAEFFEKHLK